METSKNKFINIELAPKQLSFDFTTNRENQKSAVVIPFNKKSQSSASDVFKRLLKHADDLKWD